MPEPTSNIEIAHLQPISLANFDGGTLDMEFQDRMTEVVEALADADRAGLCTVTIKLQFKPSKRKGFVESTAQVTTSIPARKRANIMMMRDGRIVQDVTSADASQPGLFPRDHTVHAKRDNA